MDYIELFAGCGGLSLGLESAEFKLLFVNELSSIASKTYVYMYIIFLMKILTSFLF
ncbi:DNA cytosine methyltransferase [Candidatus Ruthia endofausta]|uniref:DNA cytosine methyltransferase n=1 Tax=Candidatus Ruthia endofausta TaxID=2738852 RepID=A0A6N0HPI7_9GAMM|nr:DNA cytosine methyltransferase [Candidatus Ruthia endofausta]QKQ24309.1 DNA cytosine methyltransferase [Candidatus Ruthia endofausta]